MPAGCNPGLKEKFIFDGVKNAILKQLQYKALKTTQRATFQPLDNLSKHNGRLCLWTARLMHFMYWAGFSGLPGL
jgi:hypothetical protein